MENKPYPTPKHYQYHDGNAIDFGDSIYEAPVPPEDTCCYPLSKPAKDHQPGGCATYLVAMGILLILSFIVIILGVPIARLFL